VPFVAAIRLVQQRLLQIIVPRELVAALVRRSKALAERDELAGRALARAQRLRVRAALRLGSKDGVLVGFLARVILASNRAPG
jgi:hypothetical protein